MSNESGVCLKAHTLFIGQMLLLQTLFIIHVIRKNTAQV